MTAIGVSELYLVTIDSFYNPQGAKLLITYLKQTDAVQLKISLIKNGTTVFEKTIDVSGQSMGSRATYPVDLTASELSSIAQNFRLTSIDSFIDMDFPWKMLADMVSPGGSREAVNDSGRDVLVQGFVDLTLHDMATSGTVDLALVDPDGNEYIIARKNAENQLRITFDIFGLLPNNWRLRVKNNSDVSGFIEIYLHDNTPGTWTTDSATFKVQELDSGGNVIDQGQATVTVKVANMQKKTLEAEAILIAGLKTYKVPP